MSTTTVESLELQIKSNSQNAASGIDALSKSLDSLKKATSGGLGLKNVAKNLNGIKTAVDNLGNITSKLNGLSRAVDALTKLGNVKVSASIGNQIKKIGTSLSSLALGEVNEKIGGLVTALKPLETLGKSSLSTTANALKKLPEAMAKLDTKKLYGQVQALTRIMQPLAVEMDKIARGFSAFPSRIQRLIAENERLQVSNTKVEKSYINLWAKFKMAYSGIKMISSTIASWISKTNNYIEDVNLFNVAMGEYAKEAGEYAERVSEVMGIDSGEWMRNQGMFMTLATGFGVVSDRAYTMSQNLTQLGYDISSFFNISYEDAMAKLQSGLAGELEPLRRIGYDLSQARLQQEAYTLGINKKVAAMTQAEKAELRYHAILTQVTTAQGDMARTLDAPANQLRVLSAQLEMAGRALGSIFIPMLNAVLPWLIAIAKVVRVIAESIASFFGFTMPEVDYSGIGSLASGAEDASDALGAASDEAKKLKKNILGIDELNVLETKDSGDSSGSNSNGGGFNFELPTYDFLSDAVNREVDTIMEKLKPAITWIKENMDTILEVVGSITTAVLAWKVVDFAYDLTKATKGLIETFKTDDVTKKRVGITLMVTGITLAATNGYSLGYDLGSGGNVSFEDFVSTLIGAAMTVAGAVITFGSTPVGWAVGIVAALVITIGSVMVGYNKALDDAQTAMVEGEIFDGEGKSLEAFIPGLEAVAGEMSPQNKQISEWGTDLQTLREDIEKTVLSIQTLSGSLAETGVVTSEEIAKLKSKFGELYTGVQQNMSLSEEIIMTALVGALKRATPEIAEQIDVLIGEYQRYVRETQGRAEELKMLINNGYDELIGKGKDDPAYKEIMENIQTWYTELGYLSGSISDSGWQWQETVRTFSATDIDFGVSAEDAKAKIGNIVGVAETALNDLAIARDTVLKEIDNAIAYASQYGSIEEVEMLGNVRQAIIDDYAAQEQGIKDELNNIFEQIQMGMIDEIKGVQEGAVEQWNNMSAWDQSQSALSEAQYTKVAMQKMQDIFDEISLEIEGHIDTLGTNGSVWASDATTKIIDALFDTKIVGIGYLNSSYKTDVETAIKTTLEDIGKSGKEDATKSGEAIANGLNNGITSKIEEIKQTTFGMGNVLNSSFCEVMDINSPSGVFEENGNFIMDGLIKGIADKVTDVVKAFATIVDDVFSKESADATGYSYGETLAKAIGRAIKNTSLPTIKGTMSATDGAASMSFKAYASGGFPTTGEVFIAREAGAEMVGSIGRRTAVANNDQIVAGIASGVASANTESNALLREQNSLLRAMLEKESGVYLDGKSLTKSVEKHQRERGRVLVTGGVY